MKRVLTLSSVLVVVLLITVVSCSALIYAKANHNMSTSTETPREDLVTGITLPSVYPNYTHEQCYTLRVPPIAKAYKCDASETYRLVRVQELKYRGSSLHCDTQAECLPLITSYLDILEGYSKYSFFIDNSSNVYGGRGWNCPYLSGQLWLAVLSQDFGPHTQPSERRRILHHVTEDMFSYARRSGFLVDDPYIEYMN